jgi:hypothetical protein
VVRVEEEALYRGPPLIEPKYAFHYQHSPSKPEPGLPFLKRLASKLQCMSHDTKEYIGDIIFRRDAAFCFKTALFVKRHKKSTGHHLGHIWEEMVKVGGGFKMLKSDIRYVARRQKQAGSFKYDKPTFQQTIKMG